MASIYDLPLEILAHILSFLPAKSLAQSCRVCKAFRDASQVESLWQNRCLSGKQETSFTKQVVIDQLHK